MSSSRCLGDLAESQLHTGSPRGEAADRVQQVCAEVAQSRASAGLHVPVMPHEVLQAWVPPSVPADGAGCVFVDGTLGHGGHTEALLRLLPAARVIGLDTDAEMVAKARKQLAQAGVLDRATLVKAPYTHIGEVLGELGQPGATGVLVDVGFNSGQVDNAARGFSFRRDGPLDGRFDPSVSGAVTAGEIVNSCNYAQLVSLLRHKGGETDMARVIARGIVEWRSRGSRRRRIRSSLELRFVIECAIARELGEPPVGLRPADVRWLTKRAATSGAYRSKGRIAGVWDRQTVWHSKKAETRIVNTLTNSRPRYLAELQRAFQALRIATNAEDWHFASLLCSLPSIVAPSGHFAALAFAPQESAALAAATDALTAQGWARELGGSVLRPHPADVRRNARARSAHLSALSAPATRTAGQDPPLALEQVGFSLQQEVFLMPLLMSLRRPLPPGGAKALTHLAAAQAKGKESVPRRVKPAAGAARAPISLADVADQLAPPPSREGDLSHLEETPFPSEDESALEGHEAPLSPDGVFLDDEDDGVFLHDEDDGGFLGDMRLPMRVVEEDATGQSTTRIVGETP